MNCFEIDCRFVIVIFSLRRRPFWTRFQSYISFKGTTTNRLLLPRQLISISTSSLSYSYCSNRFLSVLLVLHLLHVDLLVFFTHFSPCFAENLGDFLLSFLLEFLDDERREAEEEEEVEVVRMGEEITWNVVHIWQEIDMTNLLVSVFLTEHLICFRLHRSAVCLLFWLLNLLSGGIAFMSFGHFLLRHFCSEREENKCKKMSKDCNSTIFQIQQ